MLRRVFERLLLSGVFLGGLAIEHSALAEIGPVAQWIQVENQHLRQRPTLVHDKSLSAEARQRRPFLEKTFEVKGPLKSATLEVMADDDAVVWFDDGTPAVRVTSFSNRWERANVTAQLNAGQHRLRISALSPVCARLRMVDQDDRQRIVVTDPTWSESYIASMDGSRTATRAVVSLGLVGIQPWGDPLGEEVDYHQWKKSINTGKAEEAATVQVTPGFEVELVRSSQPGESSWISLTFDPAGRVIIGCEGRDKKHGLLRLTLPKQLGGEVQAESFEETLLEPRGLEFYGSDLFVNANNAHSLVRLRDTDNDGRFDEQTVLKKTSGGVGHGRNNLTFGPDGKLYSIHGNDVRLPGDFNAAKDMRVPFMALDRLRPCDWDGFLFDRNATLPAGHLVRTDINGSRWEVIATGFRNPYGIHFNEDGEAFTFDADNEGDLGAPWYRATRINHVVEGGDYGWRQGTAMRPFWYPDSMPSTLVIGKSSPTGIKFGTKSSFPPRYRQSLFILDWSYGRIYAVQLLPQGASYVGTAEVFVEGRPLNVTDLTFGPDGAMYFTTGGRGTQSGLYRVRYVGPESVIAPRNVLSADQLEKSVIARQRRRRLESMTPQVGDLPQIVEGLDDDDEWIRHAAMTPLMRVDPAVLFARNLGTPARLAKFCDEQDCRFYVGLVMTNLKTSIGRFSACMTLARLSPDEEQATLIKLICNEWDQCVAAGRTSQSPLYFGPSPKERRIALRALQLCLIQVAELTPELRTRVIKIAGAALNGDVHENYLFAFQILAHLNAAPIDKAIARLKAANRPQDQERALAWLFELRNIKTGWTPETRKAYLTALRHAGEHYTGGRELPVVLYSIGADFKATLSDEEREQFAELLKAPEPVVSATILPQRPLVKEWSVEDIVPSFAKFELTRERVERGQKIFEQANCVKCHRLAGKGQPIGPDLNGVSARMGRKDLLETIISPSKVIDDKYRDTTLELKSGKVLTGRMIGGDATRVLISPNPLAPLATVPVLRSEIETQKVSTISPMPVGLLNSFHTEEILDLLAYLESNGATGR